MRLFFSEFKHNYSKYYFPYQVWLLKENGDDIGKIYNMGFLPFRHRINLFYLARSSRSDLSKFYLSSENRRILSLTRDYEYDEFFLKNFEYNFFLQKRCKEWAHFSGWKISANSIKYLFGGSFFNILWVWKDKNNPNNIIGYQIIYEEENFSHVAYIFVHPNYAKKLLAIRMVLEKVIKCFEEKKKYCYLGTCYGTSGYYKRTMPGFQFFNGFDWSCKIKELDYLNKREKEGYLLGEEEYLEKFWQEGKLDAILSLKGIKLD